MKKYTAKIKRIDYFDIGNDIKLMNILTKNDYGKVNRIDTYIGTEEMGFSHVGVARDLSEPGTIFSYSGYMRMIECNINNYLEMYEGNIHQYEGIIRKN